MDDTALISSIEKLTILPGDMVIVRLPAMTDERSRVYVLRAVEGMLSRLGHNDVVVLAVNEHVSIETLPEAEMRRHGWRRGE